MMLRSAVLLGIFSCSISLAAQPGMPYCIWEDQNTNVYFFSRLDASTGTLTTIAAIPGLDAFAAGNKTAYNTDLDHYHFVGLNNGSFRFYTIDVGTGTVISDPIITENVVGIEYNRRDSMLYGLREQGNSYDLVTMDPVTAMSNSIGPMGSINAYVGETFTLNEGRQSYSFVALFGGLLRLREYDLVDASLLSDVPFPDALTGLNYVCRDSTVLALWEDGNDYKMERIGQNGTHTTVAVLNNVTPGFVAASSSMHGSGVYTYRGFNGQNDFAVISIDVTTGTVLHNSVTMDNAVGFEEADDCVMSVSVMAPPADKAMLTTFPQPFNETVLLQCGTPIRSVHVHALNGVSVVSTQVQGSTSVQLNTHAWEPGMYVLEAETEEGTVLRRRLLKGN